MKINSRTVWQMTDDGMHIVEQDSFDYDGPVAECFKKSKSSTTQTTSNVQNIVNRNINLSDFEGIGIADARDVEITIQQTDSGAIAAASQFGAGALSLAGDVTAQAIRASERSLTEGLDFAEDTLAEGFRFGSDVVDESLSFADDSSRRSFGFSRDIAGGAFDLTRRSTRDAFGFSSDVSGQAFDASGRALKANENVINRALNFAKDLTRTTTDTLSGAIGAAADATRSDASQVLNNITKFGAVAIAVVGLAFIVVRARA